MRTSLKTMLAVGVLAFFSTGCVGAKKTATPTPTDVQATPGNAERPSPRGGNGNGGDDIKPYDEVITKDAVSDEGVFTVHHVKDDYFFEIPNDLLEREMLLVSRIAKTADNIGYGGEQSGNHMVRWTRQDDTILLRVVSYQNRADADSPMFMAVKNSNFEPILMSFPIKAYNEDSTAVVVDVDGMFTSDVPALGLQSGRRQQYQVRRVDGSRTFINYMKAFPENVEVRNTITYDAGQPPSNSSTGTISLEMNHSMLLLPEEPMMPRLADPRVGYFTTTTTNYGLDAQRAESESYVVRWKLEPSDRAAFQRGELVEPVEPIVYYIDPATPDAWRPYLKQGVEDWNAAFEAAGFRNAIRAADPPSADEDPEFSPEDARYSVIRYFASDIQNAYGPNVHDPRSGQIIESDIGWFHNVMNLLRNWYFVQTAAINPDARAVKFRDEVMGELVRFVSAHEVGHTLGLPHNMKASSSYPVDSLRSATFTRAFGTAPSIMDYARFNYVAQPGDDGVSLMPGIGPYDKYAVMWGYRPIPEARTPQEELPVLNAWIRAREDDPIYRFGNPSSIDPGSQTEDLGDDSILASEYGVANLKRIMPRLMDWTEDVEGSTYDDLEELYGQVIGQWNRYMGHVANNVGGVFETRKAWGQSGAVYEIVPEERQRRAVQFLADEAWTTPTWMIETDILDRIGTPNSVDQLRARQASVLNRVLAFDKLQRLIESEARIGDAAYTIGELFTDVRGAVFGDMRDLDPYERALQRAYVERMEYLMTEEQTPIPPQFRAFVTRTNVDVSQSDIRAFARGELVDLKTVVDRAARRGVDTTTRLHLLDLSARIDAVLNPAD